MTRPIATWQRTRLNERQIARSSNHLAWLVFAGVVQVILSQLPRTGAIFGGEGGLLIGLVMLGFAAIWRVVYRPWDKALRTALEAQARRAGLRGGVPVKVRLERHGEVTGRDIGWLARTEDALVFEGRRTQFALTQADLTMPVLITSLEVCHGSRKLRIYLEPVGDDPVAPVREVLSDLPAGPTDDPLPPFAAQPQHIALKADGRIGLALGVGFFLTIGIGSPLWVLSIFGFMAVFATATITLLGVDRVPLNDAEGKTAELDALDPPRTEELPQQVTA